jgi:hypothetical protein
MEKNDNWAVGDYILDKDKDRINKIVGIRKGEHSTDILSIDIKTGFGVADPLLFMHRYWINLGNSKYWEILYGTKGKNDTNIISD